VTTGVPLAARIGSGWYAPEPLGGAAARMRWLDGTGTVEVWNLGATPLEATLEVDAWSFQRPRRLAISVDGRVVGEWQIGDRQRIALPVALGPGRHRVELRAEGEPVRPVDVGVGADPRPLTIGVTGVTIRR
jgi:hypothetical protein